MSLSTSSVFWKKFQGSYQILPGVMHRLGKTLSLACCRGAQFQPLHSCHPRQLPLGGSKAIRLAEPCLLGICTSLEFILKFWEQEFSLIKIPDKGIGFCVLPVFSRFSLWLLKSALISNLMPTNKLTLSQSLTLCLHSSKVLCGPNHIKEQEDDNTGSSPVALERSFLDYLRSQW